MTGKIPSNSILTSRQGDPLLTPIRESKVYITTGDALFSFMLSSGLIGVGAYLIVGGSTFDQTPHRLSIITGASLIMVGMIFSGCVVRAKFFPSKDVWCREINGNESPQMRREKEKTISLFSKSQN